MKENEKLDILLGKQKYYLLDKTGLDKMKNTIRIYLWNQILQAIIWLVIIMKKMDISIHVSSRENVIRKYKLLR